MAKVLGVVVVAVTTLSGFVHAEPMLFGQLRADYGFVDDSHEGERYRINEHGSRIGIKGATLVDAQTEFTYIVEAESDIAGANEVISEVRQAWIGLRGHGAELRVGRHLSPTRVSVAPVDLFTNQGADQRKILESDQVMSKSLVYLSRVDNLAYAVALSTDNANERSATDVLFNYTTENTYLAVAYLKGYNRQRASRLAATYRFPAGHTLGLAFEYLDDKGAGDDHKAYVASAGYQLDEQKTAKFQYGANKPSTRGKTETLFGLGLDYDLSTSTTLQFQYSTNRHIDHYNKNEKALTVGIRYDF